MNDEEETTNGRAFNECMGKVAERMERLQGLGADCNQGYEIDPYLHGMMAALRPVGEAIYVDEGNENLFYDRLKIEEVIRLLIPGSSLEKSLEEFLRGMETVSDILKKFIEEEENELTD